MKTFSCPSCRHAVYFENVRCLNCGTELGFQPTLLYVAALERTDGDRSLKPTRESVFRAHTHSPSLHPAIPEMVRLCANRIEHDVCNWTVAADDPQPFCLSCRLNTVIPNLSIPGASAAWARLEAAKRRLLSTILSLSLPLATRQEDPKAGLGFAFKQDVEGDTVRTGHDRGIITINISEADDVQRERNRAELGERFRSLAGHFRHESGHYYWMRLIEDGPWHDAFRETFGDEREDYAQAIARHHAGGPPVDWQTHHISRYASAHPWEDWAETWAHYLHMVDTLDTARSYEIAVRQRPTGEETPPRVAFASLSRNSFDEMITAWTALTSALNDFNRGMGLPDLYPFVLSPGAVEKLRFVHRVIHAEPAPVPVADAAEAVVKEA